MDYTLIRVSYTRENEHGTWWHHVGLVFGKSSSSLIHAKRGSMGLFPGPIHWTGRRATIRIERDQGDGYIQQGCQSHGGVHPQCQVFAPEHPHATGVSSSVSARVKKGVLRKYRRASGLRLGYTVLSGLYIRLYYIRLKEDCLRGPSLRIHPTWTYLSKMDQTDNPSSLLKDFNLVWIFWWNYHVWSRV